MSTTMTTYVQNQRADTGARPGEQPEVGYGLYYKGKFKDLNLDLYAIRKDTDSTSISIESGINTFGARIKYLGEGSRRGRRGASERFLWR